MTKSNPTENDKLTGPENEERIYEETMSTKSQTTSPTSNKKIKIESGKQESRGRKRSKTRMKTTRRQ